MKKLLAIVVLGLFIASQAQAKVKSKDINFANDFYVSSLSSKKTDGSDQLRRPEITYGLNINKKLQNNFIGKFNLNMNYKHYGKHFDTHSANFSTIEIDSTDIVNVSLKKNYGSLELYINSRNLFNEIYQRPHGYSQDDRTFRFGIKTYY